VHLAYFLEIYSLLYLRYDVMYARAVGNAWRLVEHKAVAANGLTVRRLFFLQRTNNARSLFP
jgi:hypothetical protein